MCLQQRNVRLVLKCFSICILSFMKSVLTAPFRLSKGLAGSGLVTTRGGGLWGSPPRSVDGAGEDLLVGGVG